MPFYLVLGFSDFPKNRKIGISENPDFRVFRNFGITISENPDFRKSENPDFQISGLPMCCASACDALAWISLDMLAAWHSDAPDIDITAALHMGVIVGWSRLI